MAMSKSFLKTAAFFLACMPALICTQGCHVLVQQRTQAIPATSRPQGVMVLVDGFAVGKTPISLKLARRDIHVVRFELAGYSPVEIRITKKRPSQDKTIMSNAGMVLLGGPLMALPVAYIWNIFSPDEYLDGLGALGRAVMAFSIGAAVSWVTAVIIDNHLPYNHELSPKTLSVEMKKINENNGTPVVIETDPSRLGDIIWIRIAVK